jgi:hypothetical protein
MVFDIMPFVLQNRKPRKLNPSEAESSVRAFWNKMNINQRHVPKSKKNMVIDIELKEGTRYMNVYGGEAQTASYTAFE